MSQLLPSTQIAIKSTSFAYFLVLVLALLTLTPLASQADCESSGHRFKFIYKSYTISNKTDKKGTVTGTFATFTFTVQNTGPHGLSHVSFGLPKGVKADNPTYTSASRKQYSVENGTFNPFYGVKFETTSADGIKGQDQPDTFSYSILIPNNTNPAEYLASVLPSISIEAKAGTTVESSTNVLGGFDFDCSDEDSQLTLLGSATPTTLPVTLVSFDGSSQNQGVALKWVTATEENNEYFQVEKSQDGKTFRAIGKVKGNGTTNQKQTYSFTDRSVTSGTYYYRLKQVDFNGKSEYSKIVAVKADNFNLVKAALYPNPASSSLNIDLTAFVAGTYSIKIASLTGAILKNQTISAGQVATLDVQSLTNGAYVLIVEGENFNQTNRFLKN
ncbi:T9SS type A sorting domain-containing protein [Adhaeribacter aquaticus]|uniref:T9SS type A sorting domain-containing protein n=1 Tax=Adhaeribacter aquaticus TaxID=299567 RepID=UPI0004145C6A|nr:T9SS type A sorting domain-containing protein [Adhaeribacter aquaticus]